MLCVRLVCQDGYGKGDAPAVMEDQRLTMRRSDAPWVKGRGGQRLECGRATSGCLGEVYKVRQAFLC